MTVAPSLRLIDDALLSEVSQAAAANPRRRQNHNFHPHNDFPAHRLLNAIEPGSYVAPHRHADASKDETMLILRGSLGLVLFNDDGSIQATHRLEANGVCLGVDIPHGTWHSVLALQAGTVFFEAKSGPYAALLAEEKAGWAPAENDPGAAAYQQQLAALFV